jgi:DNA-binding PadR family transcriptional regulator
MSDKVRVTVKEKILIHLLGFSKYKDEFEVPQKVTQDGMAKVIGVRRSHIASALKDLKASELLEDTKTRIQGQERRKNAYFLTPSGEIEAHRIKESVHEKSIWVKDEEGNPKEINILEFQKTHDKKMNLIEILSCINSQGEFKEKEEEKKEPENAVNCPFCHNTNFNFEMKEVPSVDGTINVSIPCTFCGGEFLAAKRMEIEEGEVVNYEPVPFIQEAQPPPPPLPTGNPFLVILGLFFMMASFILALLVGLSQIPGDLCLIAPLGFIISLGVLYVGLKDVKHLDFISRRLLFVLGTFFMTFIAVFVCLSLGAQYDLEEVGIMATVVLPAFFVLAFAKPLSPKMRSEISLSLGVFLLLLGVVISVYYELFSQSVWYSPYWVIAGSVLLFTSYEVHRLDRILVIRSGCVGVGSFMAIFCLVVLNAWYSELGIFKVAGIILWLVFMLFLIYLRFVGISTFETILTALKTSLLAGVGLLFVLVGIILGINGRLMQAGVEFFIGVPIMWYGLNNVRDLAFSQIAIILYVLAAEITLVLSLVLT